MKTEKIKQIKKAIELYMSGESLRDAAKQAGTTQDALRYHLIKQGIKRRSSGEGLSLKLRKGKKLPTEEELKHLYVNLKKSLREIAKMYNVDRSTIKRDLLKAGIPIRSQGHPIVEKSKGRCKENNPKWNGGQHKTKQGYVKVLMPGHKRADSKGYVPRAVLVWETTHKKSLPDNWVVHHINGIKDDDRPENLMAMLDHDHRVLHGKQRRKQYDNGQFREQGFSIN